MEVALSQRQLNNLVKGRPVQIKHSDLTSDKPNTAINMLGDAMKKKVDRAIREKRGCRVQLSPEEAQSVKTELGGGKINIGKAFKNLGKDIKKTANKAVSGVKDVAKTIDRGFKKEIVDSGVGKQIARSLIDVGTDVVLPTALAGLSTYATGNPMLGEIAGKVAGDQLNKLAGRYGYGVKGKALKDIKSTMEKVVRPAVRTAKEAKALTTRVFKEGERVLDLPEISITGGKISLKKIGRDLKKTAKDLWRKAKPVLKHFGEEALEMATPMIEEGLASVAESYGVDPMTAELGAKTATAYGKKKAKRGMDKYLTKQKSQTPEMALDKVSAIVQDRGDDMIKQAKLKGLESIQKYVPPEQRDYATELLLSQTNKAETALRDGVEGVEGDLRTRLDRLKEAKQGRGRVGRAVLANGRIMPVVSGGAIMRDDMGTLLSSTHPATMPLKPRPNLPQGQISGGSFRGYSGRGSLAMDTMLGGSFR